MRRANERRDSFPARVIFSVSWRLTVNLPIFISPGPWVPMERNCPLLVIAQCEGAEPHLEKLVPGRAGGGEFFFHFFAAEAARKG